MIYVTGANGQLGNELKRHLPDAHFLNRESLDLSNLNQVEEILKSTKISILINCAAYNQVDLAEKEKELAFKINAEVPGLFSRYSLKNKFKLIHFSTDYVFDGKCSAPYSEDQKAEPLNYYGQTKLEGEKRVMDENPNNLVIRTSWVHSQFGNNFVKTLLKAGREREELNVVFDQVGTLTWASDLADAALKARELKGIFHYSNEGVSSRYDVVVELKRLKKFKAKVNPILTEAYPAPAKRPHYSVLDKSKIKKALNINIPHWTESLEKCLQQLS
ncbi:MAG: dTDP-4-dehydrorhamnose reductase [Bacteriovoracaceae bacterium]|nr:dTDP-4-dehydrorhamnose reductase [Bacteriovoracaceae bacterium]